MSGDIKTILEQNIEGERCAIKFYKDLLTQVQDYTELEKDIVIILKDEEEHERDLTEILNKV
jgi:bacterioferritin